RAALRVAGLRARAALGLDPDRVGAAALLPGGCERALDLAQVAAQRDAECARRDPPLAPARGPAAVAGVEPLPRPGLEVDPERAAAALDEAQVDGVHSVGGDAVLRASEAAGRAARLTGQLEAVALAARLDDAQLLAGEAGLRIEVAREA